MPSTEFKQDKVPTGKPVDLRYVLSVLVAGISLTCLLQKVYQFGVWPIFADLLAYYRECIYCLVCFLPKLIFDIDIPLWLANMWTLSGVTAATFTRIWLYKCAQAATEDLQLKRDFSRVYRPLSPDNTEEEHVAFEDAFVERHKEAYVRQMRMLHLLAYPLCVLVALSMLPLLAQVCALSMPFIKDGRQRILQMLKADDYEEMQGIEGYTIVLSCIHFYGALIVFLIFFALNAYAPSAPRI